MHVAKFEEALYSAKLSRFSLDTLVTMLLRTGKSVELLVQFNSSQKQWAKTLAS